MAGIVKTYKQSVPATRFIGKIDPYQGGGWGEWHENGWFGIIEDAAGGAEAINKLYEDSGAYIGLLHLSKDYNVLEYWIGMFVPPETKVPEGFQSIDYPAQNFGVCWIQGKDMGEITSNYWKAAGSIMENGMEIIYEDDGSFWDFERYQCPRYTTPDKNGNITVDFCYFVK